MYKKNKNIRQSELTDFESRNSKNKIKIDKETNKL